MSRLQPRLKVSPTSHISSQDVSIHPVEKLKPMPARKPHASPADFLSDRATLFLVRRTLCFHVGDKGRSTPAPIDEILPPLTSSNEVDLQLYAFIAIIIREYVHTWYHKITQDQIFVEELIKIIAHCTRAVEQRLRKVDLESFLLDQLPELLDAHVQAFRISHLPLHPPPFEQDSRQIYHSLWPFPALEPVPINHSSTYLAQQLANESTYRQLIVQGVLALLLPTEDLENNCLTSIVSQTLSEIIGGAIGEKVTEPWLLWEGITKLAEMIKSQMPTSMVNVRVDCLAESKQEEPERNRSLGYRIGSSIQNIFWVVLQYAFLAFIVIRFLVTIFATSSCLPTHIEPESKDSDFHHSHNDSTDLSHRQRLLSKKPILVMKIWTCASNLLDLDMRMPWLRATLSMLQWGALTGPGQIGKTDGIINKLLSHAIQTHVLAPTTLPNILRAARAALFPNNMPALARPEPDVAGCLAIRRRCAEAIIDIIPVGVRDVYFGPGIDKMVQEVEGGLDIFGDAYCNKHLVYGIAELILVRLMPELSESGIEDLLGQRLN